MNKILSLFIVFLTVNSFAAIEFGCHPLEPSWNNSVEGAILKNESGVDQLAYYLTSETWGAVDEYIETAQTQRSEGRVLVSGNTATLEILLDRTVGDIEGEYLATLSVPGKNIRTEMYCLRGEF